jgi:hypothetical protein
MPGSSRRRLVTTNQERAMASRIRRVILAVFVALGLAASVQASPAFADVQLDISVFHDGLAPYGQ